MYKILLVEDDINIVNHLSSFLEKEGFLITYVDGQKKAIELIKNQHFDLALLDISLKEGNGYSLYNEIKSYKDIPIVFLTANQDEFSVVTGLNLGAADEFCTTLSTTFIFVHLLITLYHMTVFYSILF